MKSIYNEHSLFVQSDELRTMEDEILPHIRKYFLDAKFNNLSYRDCSHHLQTIVGLIESEFVMVHRVTTNAIQP